MKFLKTTAFIFFCLSFHLSRAQTETFTFTGAVQTYTVPDGITTIQIECWGAQGQALTDEQYSQSTGGLGGYAIGELSVTPGEVLNIYVGGTGTEDVAGFNGGALGGFGTPSDGDAGRAGSGGGASDVRLGGAALSDRVIVAGGGGGGGRDYVNGWCQPCGTGGNGGAGGGLVGADGFDPADPIYGIYFNPGSGGKGGTDATGGAGGAGTEGPNGNSGTLGAGGMGVNGNFSIASGGGGGGYYGGGSGAGANFGSGAAGGGGAGGSSYIGGVSDGSTLPGVRLGNGLVVITPLCIPIEITSSATELCLGHELTLTGTSVHGGTVSWDGGAVNGLPFVSGPVGIITYTASSDHASDCSASIDIEVFALPTVVASADETAICFGESVVFSESGDADTYFWDPVEVVSGDPYSPDVGLVTYTLTGTHASTGCQNSSSVTVEVYELPAVSAGEDFAICFGDEATLAGAGAGVGGSYSWDGGVTNAVPFSPAITDNYIVIGTDINGCSNADTMTLIVNSLPVIEAGDNDSLCLGGDVVLTAAGLGDEDGYTWSDGISNGIPFSPDETQYYFLTGTDENGCVNIDSVLVFVYALPLIEAGENQTVCYGELVTLSGEGAGPDGMYSWSDGVLDGDTFLPETTNTYYLTGTDENGCESNDSLIVEVYELPPVYGGDDREICIGEEVTLVGTGAGVGGTYVWDEGVIDGDTFMPVTTNEYILIGTDDNGCSNTDTVLVTVHALPVIFAGDDILVCEGETVVLNANGAGSDGAYSWDNGVTNGDDFVPDSDQTRIVIGTDENGCENSDTLIITLKPSPILDGGADQVICLEGEVILSVVNYDESLTYTWSNGVSDGVPFIGYIEGDFFYTVTALNDEGCESMDEVKVELVNCDTILVLPTGFSPNNDGVNDYLVFNGIEPEFEVHLAVYNEWGMLLFESYDYQDDWDGRNQLGTAMQKNTELPVGTYYYVLKYDDQVIKNYLYIER